ncbi:hypothetical protein HDV05_008466, partial [Chytridiales sp. JEL 0842]
MDSIIEDDDSFLDSVPPLARTATRKPLGRTATIRGPAENDPQQPIPPPPVPLKIKKSSDPLSREAQKRKEQRAIALFELIDREKEKDAVKRRAALADKVKKQRERISKLSSLQEEARLKRQQQADTHRRELVKKKYDTLLSIHSPWIVIRQDPIAHQKLHGNIPGKTGTADSSFENLTAVFRGSLPSIKAKASNVGLQKASQSKTTIRLSRKISSRESDKSHTTEITDLHGSIYNMWQATETSLKQGHSTLSIDSNGFGHHNSSGSARKFSRMPSELSERGGKQEKFRTSAVMNAVSEWNPHRKKIYHGHFYNMNLANVRQNRERQKQRIIPVSKRYPYDFFKPGVGQNIVKTGTSIAEGKQAPSTRKAKTPRKSYSNVQSKVVTRSIASFKSSSKVRKRLRTRSVHDRRGSISDTVAILKVFQTEEAFQAFKGRYHRPVSAYDPEKKNRENLDLALRGVNRKRSRNVQMWSQARKNYSRTVAFCCGGGVTGDIVPEEARKIMDELFSELQDHGKSLDWFRRKPSDSDDDSSSNDSSETNTDTQVQDISQAKKDFAETLSQSFATPLPLARRASAISDESLNANQQIRLHTAERRRSLISSSNGKSKALSMDDITGTEIISESETTATESEKGESQPSEAAVEKPNQDFNPFEAPPTLTQTQRVESPEPIPNIVEPQPEEIKPPSRRKSIVRRKSISSANSSVSGNGATAWDMLMLKLLAKPKKEEPASILDDICAPSQPERDKVPQNDDNNLFVSKLRFKAALKEARGTSFAKFDSVSEKAEIQTKSRTTSVIDNDTAPKKITPSPSFTEEPENQRPSIAKAQDDASEYRSLTFPKKAPAQEFDQYRSLKLPKQMSIHDASHKPNIFSRILSDIEHESTSIRDVAQDKKHDENEANVARERRASRQKSVSEDGYYMDQVPIKTISLAEDYDDCEVHSPPPEPNVISLAFKNPEEPLDIHDAEAEAKVKLRRENLRKDRARRLWEPL